MSQIIKFDKLAKDRFILKAYAVWNVSKSSWVIIQSDSTFCHGIWIDRDKIPERFHSDDYKIIEVSLPEIPEDIIRILSLDKEMFADCEKIDMAYSKLRQLFHIFVFRNEKLKETIRR